MFSNTPADLWWLFAFSVRFLKAFDKARLAGIGRADFLMSDAVPCRSESSEESKAIRMKQAFALDSSSYLLGMTWR
jgi:hypothetical protein